MYSNIYLLRNVIENNLSRFFFLYFILYMAGGHFDHARAEVHARHLEGFLGEDGGENPGTAPQVRDLARRLEPANPKAGANQALVARGRKDVVFVGLGVAVEEFDFFGLVLVQELDPSI